MFLSLAAGVIYAGSVILSNESVSPAEDITQEVSDEAEEHQFFYNLAGVDATLAYTDEDADGNPVGITFSLVTGAAGEGTMTVILRHLHDKSAGGVRPLLQARGVHRSFVLGRRTLQVLRRVSFTVQRGEFVALRGASGAGKSTLLHLLGGLDPPNGGGVEFEGRNLSAFSSFYLARWRNRKIGLALLSKAWGNER